MLFPNSKTGQSLGGTLHPFFGDVTGISFYKFKGTVIQLPVVFILEEVRSLVSIPRDNGVH